MNRLLLPAGLATLTLGVAACGGGGYSSSSPSAPSNAPPPAGAITINVVRENGNQSFSPNPAAVPNGTDRGVAQRRYDDAPRGAQRRQTGYRKPRTRRVQRADDARRANPLPLLDSSRHGRLACESVKLTLSEGDRARLNDVAVHAPACESMAGESSAFVRRVCRRIDAFGGAGLRSRAMRRPRCSRPCRTPSYLSGTPHMPRRLNHVTSFDGRNTYAPHEACIGDEAITLFACPLYEPQGCGLGAGAKRKHERAVSRRPAGR